MIASFRPGDVVVFRKQKASKRPGPHARDVEPSPRGEFYSYLVDKFWRVVEVEPSGTLLVRTRRGKQHQIKADDPNLRPVCWWERLLRSARFPPA
jgi:hypothetical protein